MGQVPSKEYALAERANWRHDQRYDLCLNGDERLRCLRDFRAPQERGPLAVDPRPTGTPLTIAATL